MENDISEIIRKNASDFPLNFMFIKPKPRKFTKDSHTLINLPKYQTDEVLIDHFYKRISRTIK